MKKPNGTTENKGAEKTNTKKSTPKKTTPKTDAQLSAIEKVRKLMEFSEEYGATEGEIENALKAAQKLMLKHGLEEGDIEKTVNDINITVVEDTWKKGTESKLFQYDLLNTIAQSFSCRVVRVILGGGRSEFHIVGLKEDRENTLAIFEMTLPQVRVLTKRRYKELDNELSAVKFTIAYQTGFLIGLREKLEEDKQSIIKSDKGVALMVVKKDDLIEEFITEQMKIGRASCRERV